MYHDQGLRVVKVWLDQLFTPYVHEAYRIVREEHGTQQLALTTGRVQPVRLTRPRLPKVPTNSATVSHLTQFNACLQPYYKRIEWKFDDTVIENNIPLWVVKLFVDGDRWGRGSGSSKREAKNEAARQGLVRARAMGWDPTNLTTFSNLDLFNIFLYHTKRVEWTFDTIIEYGRPIWTVNLFVDGDRWGYARGDAEKVAKDKAATQGLARVYSEEHTLMISEG